MISFIRDCRIEGDGTIRTILAIIITMLFFGWALAQCIVGVW